MDCQRDTEACSPLQTQLFSLQGHTALVTGAGSGLGKYMAHALLHAGANLILVGRTLDRLEASADEIFLSLKQQGGHLAYDSDPAARSAHRDPDQNKRIACIAFDVSELKTLPELAQKASQPFGAPDILVNAAGLNPRKPWNELTPEIWEYTLRLNLSAPFFLAQALVPEMMRQGWGRIINIASIAGLGGNPVEMKTIAYNTSKGAVINFTRALAGEWGVYGIGVNAICPGFFKTKMATVLIEQLGEEKMASHAPLRRLGDDAVLSLKEYNEKVQQVILHICDGLDGAEDGIISDLQGAHGKRAEVLAALEKTLNPAQLAFLREMSADSTLSTHTSKI